MLQVGQLSCDVAFVNAKVLRQLVLRQSGQAADGYEVGDLTAAQIGVLQGEGLLGEGAGEDGIHLAGQIGENVHSGLRFWDEWDTRVVAFGME